MVLPRATAAALFPDFLPVSCPSRALPTASPTHTAMTPRFAAYFLTVPPCRFVQDFSIFHIPAADFHPPPVNKDSLRLCTASTFVPLIFLQISLHNSLMSKE